MHTQLENSQARQGQSKKSNDFNSPVSKHSQVLVKAQLEMTTPGDSDEQEADEMADSIVSEGRIARSVSAGHSGGGVALPSQFGSRIASFQGQGSSITGDLKTRMESGFGRDFSNVRLHTDDAAAEMSSSISAKAFTYGNDIFFNRGQYSPDTKDGQHLLAHELTHTVQHSRKIARDPEPESFQLDNDSPKGVQATVKEEENLRGGLIKSLMDVGYVYGPRSETINCSEPEDGKTKMSSAIADCNKLLGIAKQLSKDPTKKELVEHIVQQVYNTLSQAMSAMNMFPRPYITDDFKTPEGKIIGEENLKAEIERLKNHRKDKMKQMKESSWYQARKPLYSAIKELAAFAHNPAISALMYEGTYYPNFYDSITSTATISAAGSSSDFSYLDEYGAVCNNAAYGAVLAAGAAYQSSSGDAAPPVVGLSRGDRAPWSTYNLQGTGLGDDALNLAKQGDVVIFWKFSKIDDAAITSREKSHKSKADKELKSFKSSVDKAKKNLGKDLPKKQTKQASDENSIPLSSAEEGGLTTEERLSALLSQLATAKSEIDALRELEKSTTKYQKPKAKEKDKQSAEREIARIITKLKEINPETDENELKDVSAIKTIILQKKDRIADLVSSVDMEVKNAEEENRKTKQGISELFAPVKETKAVLEALDALKEAAVKYQKATKEKDINKAEKELNKKWAAIPDTIKEEMGEDDFKDVDAIKEYYNITKERYADLLIAADMDAHHTEIIVGVDKERNRYLLSGAHGQAKVNGLVRDNGELEWKSVYEIRGENILRRIPTIAKQEATDEGAQESISVNISSEMRKQTYKPTKQGQYTIIQKKYDKQSKQNYGVYEQVDIKQFVSNKEKVKIEWLTPQSSS